MVARAALLHYAQASPCRQAAQIQTAPCFPTSSAAYPLDSYGKPRPVFYRTGPDSGWEEVPLQPGDLPPCTSTQAGAAPPDSER